MEPIRILKQDLVLVDYGPMTMTISAWRQGKAMPVIAAKAAWQALLCLKDLANFKNYMKIKAQDLPLGRKLPNVVSKALYAARLKPHDLTPMAAVAGACADVCAQYAFDLGADKVLANNGGDVSLKLGPDNKALVGVNKPDQEQENKNSFVGKLKIKGSDGIGGVATSGWSGRSMSLGVADLVTVWSHTAAKADALATFIASKTNVQSKAVKRAKAHSIAAENDLQHMEITKDPGLLSVGERLYALGKGLKTATSLLDQGEIMGCVLMVQNEMAYLDPKGVFTRS